MSGNYWVVKVAKNSDGKVYLKFWGQIPIPVKYVGWLLRFSVLLCLM